MISHDDGIKSATEYELDMSFENFGKIKFNIVSKTDFQIVCIKCPNIGGIIQDMI